MAEPQKLTMRVIVTEGDIRKMTMTPKPDTLEQLIRWLKDALPASYNFALQYQDPEFNNELCNLTDVSELPHKPTIKIIPVIDLVPVPDQSELWSDTTSQADTEILPIIISPTRSSQWPETFEIPKFSVDVEYRLRQGNLLHLKDGSHLKVTKELKHEILQTLAETIYTFKAYPQKEDCAAVAKSLVQTHPCLQEKGSSGWEGWKNSIYFKIGNYRTKLRKMGRLDVSVNGGKRGRHTPDGDHPSKDLKRPKKGELNFLPDYPEGMAGHNLEGARQLLVQEMMKAKPDALLVKKEMDVTFALRRQEVVNEKPAINLMLQRWPALFTESQVSKSVLNT